MRKLFIFVIFFLMATSGRSQTAAIDTTQRLLVVSGGGARGAWGAGVLTEFVKKNGGYKAVFGTSTGSLMAPLVLLKDMDLLDSAYTHITQSSIFNKNPFHVTYDTTTGTVTTGFNLRAILRFIFGYKTFGETKNLLKLIHQFVPRPRYDSLLDLYRDQKLVMAVAVTNTRTGLLEMIYDSAFTKTDTGYENLCRWIWASANEPLYMSYVPMGNSSYVDGGVREVIPIQEGLTYAINHDIDNIDVIINNGKMPIDQNWNVNGGGILNGLERLLGIYDLGTVHYNETYATLLARYFNQVGSLPHPEAAAAAGGATAKRLIHLNLYWMPQELATTYQNELGVVQAAMQVLLAQGKIFGANPAPNRIRIDIDREAVKQNAGMLSNQ